MPTGPWKSFASDQRSGGEGETGAPAEGSRGRILGYVSTRPGAHLRQMCRDLGLAMGDVQYQVGRLEREGRIVSVRRGFYRFFYPASLFAQRQRDVLSVLSLDTPRELLLAVIGAPGSSQEELARLVGVSQPTASWHLKRLVELGVVEKKEKGKSYRYRLLGSSPEEVTAFLKSYHPSAWERWSGRLADIFISYSKEEAAESR